MKDSLEYLNNKISSKSHLVDNINIDFEIHLCILSKVAHLPVIKIKGELPLLNINFSDHKYKTLLKIIDLVVPKTEQNIEVNKKISFTKNKYLEDKAPLIEEEDTFYDAEESISDKDVYLQKKQFQFEFKISRLHALICEHNENEDNRLVDSVLEEFEILIITYPYHFTVDISMNKFDVFDLMNIDSKNFTHFVKSQTNGHNKKLMNIQYVNVSDLSPELYDTHKGVNQKLNVSFNNFDLIVTQKSILSLYYYILKTFVPENQDSKIENNKNKPLMKSNEDNNEKVLNSIIHIDTDIKHLKIILNDNDSALATVNLENTQIGILISDGMKFNLKIENFGIVDNIFSSNDGFHAFRQLFTIEGSEIINITYETFSEKFIDLKKYDSALTIRLGSGRLTFVESTLRQLLNYFSKFAEMHVLFETARLKAMESAAQIQNKANRMQFDILIQTPYIIFPKSLDSKDILVANLGELKIINKYEPLNDLNKEFINNINFNLNSINLSSTLYFGHVKQSMQIINDVDININMKYFQNAQEHIENDLNKYPELNINGKISDIHLHLTRAQYSFVLFAFYSILNLLNNDSETSVEDLKANEGNTIVEESICSKNSSSANIYQKLFASFYLKNSVLELFDGEQNQQKLKLNSKLVKISLKDFKVEYTYMSNLQSFIQSSIKHFIVTDTRSGNKQKFQDIVVPRSSNDIQLHIKLKQIPQSPSDLNIKMESPKIILAIDYLFKIKDFLTSPFNEGGYNSIANDNNAKSNESSNISRTTNTENSFLDMWMFRIEVLDTEVILLKEMDDPTCEAVALNIKKVVLSHYGILSLSINNVNMSLCQLNVKNGFSLNFIENFDILLSMDSRYMKPGHNVTNIVVDIKPITLRVSYRDIIIISQVCNKLYELMFYDQKDSNNIEVNLSESKNIRDRDSLSNLPLKVTSNNVAYRILSKESLKVNFQGIEIIIIKDILDLPVIDTVLESFTFNVSNWSNQLTADTQISIYSNIFNLKNSHWEPLIEQWKFGINIFRPSPNQAMKMELGSRQLLDINITPSVVSTLISVYEECLVNNPLTTPRGSHIPYVIKNRTGYPIHVWSETRSDSKIHVISNGEDKPWRFTDWLKTRENKYKEPNTLNLQFDGITLESIKKINIDKEGTHLFHLRPKINNVTYQLLCRVELDNNVKTITFSSPLIIKNFTQLTLELVVVNQRRIWMDESVTIDPNNEHAISLKYVYEYGFLIRPSGEFGYQWSSKIIHWKDIFAQKSSYQSISCYSQDISNSAFWLKMNVEYDTKLKNFPKAFINIYPPLEIENLLPYDMNIKLRDIIKSYEWPYLIKKTERINIHVVDSNNHLSLTTVIEDAGFRTCDPVIIAPFNRNKNEISDKIMLYDNQNLPLVLKLNYNKKENDADRLKISIYCPYILINKTGLKMLYKTKSMVYGERSVAGQNNNFINSSYPFMFSYGTNDGKRRARIKIEDSEWSEPMSFEAVGSTSEIVLKSKSGYDEIYIGFKVEQGYGEYYLSKFVTFTPRFIIINDSHKSINVRELGSSKVTTVKSGDRIPLHFIRQSNDKQLTISYPGINNQWSSPFKIDAVGKTYITLKKYRQQKDTDLIKIDIVLEGSVLFLVFKNETSWPYEIINESSYEIKFYQGDDFNNISNSSEQLKYILPSKSKANYTWDYPSAKKKFLVLDVCGSHREISFMEIGSLVPLKFKQKGTLKFLSIDVISEGLTLKLKLNDYQQSKSPYKIKRNDSTIHSSNGMSRASIQNFEVIEKDLKTLFSLQFTFKGIGISLINEKEKEILYITLRNISVKYDDSNLSQTINCNVKWIQIDNQMYECTYPILLYPTVVPRYGQELDNHPFFQLVIIKSKDQSYGVEFYKYFTFLMQELSIEVDEDFLYVLSDFAKHINSLMSKDSESKNRQAPDLFKNEMEIPSLNNLELPQQTFFEILHIQPIKLDLSFTRTERTREDVHESRNPLSLLLKVLTMTIGSINDAPIKLNALMLENVLVSYPILYDRIYNYYSQEVVFQFHKIIGSADFIGNPVGLFNNLSSGVVDMFYEPYQGFVLDGPQDLGVGIARGTASFVKKTVYGFSDSFYKITQSLGKGLSVATMDKAYQDRRTSMVRNKPKHAFYGVTQGGYSFATSLVSGLSGVVTQPIKGAEKEGLGGFFKGFGKGVVGVVTKPVVGVFDLASSVTEGIRNSTTVFDNNQIDRCRLPRHIKKSGILTRYDTEEAFGQFLLYQLKYARYYKEGYIGHFEIKSTKNIILITSLRCLLVKPTNLSIEWEVAFSGLCFMLNRGIPGPFIPITDRTKKEWLFMLLKSTFDEYVRANKDMD